MPCLILFLVPLHDLFILFGHLVLPVSLTLQHIDQETDKIEQHGHTNQSYDDTIHRSQVDSVVANSTDHAEKRYDDVD